MIKDIFSLLRPFQWVKNFFVFLPLFFGGKLLDWGCWLQALLAFVSFSMISSAVYCLNDIRDVEVDRLHPVKRRRPVASGRVPVSVAFAMMTLMILLSLAVSLFCLSEAPMTVSAVISAYFLMNVAYCFCLKYHAIIDVFIISVGFVLRIVAGGLACDIWLSPWIVLMTFLLALFLAFAKRRDDVVLYETEGIALRKASMHYNLPFLNQTLGLLAAVTIVCYIIYTVSPEVETRFNNRYVYLTAVFVIAGILRYLQMTIVDVKSGSPTKILLKDRFIRCCIALWMLSFVIILYL